MKWFLTLFLLVWAIPTTLPAGLLVERDAKHEETWKKFNEAVDSKTKEIKRLVFGPVTKILGMLGIAYGIISMLATATTKPLITYGGIGLLLNIIPFFIDSVFSALLPRM